MFPPFNDVPGYPLVFPVFWGAAAFFALAMARHLRIFAIARPSHPFDRISHRLVGLTIEQQRHPAGVIDQLTAQGWMA